MGLLGAMNPDRPMTTSSVLCIALILSLGLHEIERTRHLAQDMPDGGTELRAGLQQRHVTMLSIAGVVGAGLFVGSGRAIAKAGPAALLAYTLASALVALVCACWVETAIAHPDSGSFSTGGLYHRLAVLVVLGVGVSHRGHGSSLHPQHLASRIIVLKPRLRDARETPWPLVLADSPDCGSR